MTPVRALKIAGVPVLLAKPRGAFAQTGLEARTELREPTTALPTVIWVHGFRADALAHARELERCADAGLLAIGIDAVGHGARADSDIAARIASTPGGALAVMSEYVDQTLQEFPALLDALVDQHRADRSNTSIVGISMGAFLVYRALRLSIPFARCVALLGAPPRDLTIPDFAAMLVAQSTSLLSITAEHDVNVPPRAVMELHTALADLSHDDTRFAHHVLRGAGHLTSAAQWAEAMQLTMAWLTAPSQD